MAAIFTASMRWTQKVHFSITPRPRTVTSGLNAIFSVSGTFLNQLKKLKRRTLYGQLFEQ